MQGNNSSSNQDNSMSNQDNSNSLSNSNSLLHQYNYNYNEGMTDFFTQLGNTNNDFPIDLNIPVQEFALGFVLRDLMHIF